VNPGAARWEYDGDWGDGVSRESLVKAPRKVTVTERLRVPGLPAAAPRDVAAQPGLLEHAVSAQRAAERAVIAHLLASARQGRSGTLVVRGEAGVGKTALLADAVEQANGMRVLHGAGVDSEVELPFAALHQLLFPVLDRIDRLPRPQGRALRGAFGLVSDARPEPFLIALGVLGLLADVARERPLLVVVDAAHWLDQVSANALVFVARRLETEPIALLLAAQDGAPQRFHAPGLPSLWLRGLDRQAAAALLEEQVGPLALEVLDRLVAETGGNPAALLELCEALSAAQLAGREPLPARLPIGARLQRAFLARVRRMPAASQTLLLVAAAEESGAVAPVLAAAAMLGVGPQALEPPEQAGLLRVIDQRLEFQHALVRSAVYQDATFAAKRAVHRVLAQVLGGVDQADRRVWHLVAAALGPDEKLAEALEGSARRARREGEPAAAASALQRASALSADAVARADRLVAAAGTAWQAGRAEWSHDLLDQAALLTADPGVRAGIDNVRGTIELEAGTPSLAGRIFVEAAELVMASRPRLAAEMLAMAGHGAWMAGDGAWLAEIGRCMLRLPGPESFRVKQLARSLLWLGRAIQGRPEGPIPAGSAMRWPRADNPRLWLWPPLVAALLGDDEAAHGVCTEVVSTMRVRGLTGPLPFALAQLALVELMLGHWPAALAHAGEGLDLARETGQEARAAGIMAELAWIAAVQGRAGDCRLLAGEALAFAMRGRSTMIVANASWALGLLDLTEGRPTEALDRLMTLTTVYRSTPVLLLAAGDLAEAAVRAGQPDAAAEVLAELERWARHGGRPWVQVIIHRCRALLSEGEDAERHFSAALDAERPGQRPFELARTELLYGEWLRRERRRFEARTHLRTALELFERLGAGPWLERARSELLATGETARKRNLGAFFQLTPQELQIARLARQGLTNREIAAQLYLSSHTVSYHLHKIFRKLGISSRAELR
jgi:DNA-binding CsgD family transcriptional regulator